jgi:hypothetical protein
MTFEMREILKSKQALTRRLATMPIGEKLRLLDELRARTPTIIASRKSLPRQRVGAGRVQEEEGLRRRSPRDLRRVPESGLRPGRR